MFGLRASTRQNARLSSDEESPGGLVQLSEVIKATRHTSKLSPSKLPLSLCALHSRDGTTPPSGRKRTVNFENDRCEMPCTSKIHLLASWSDEINFVSINRFKLRSFLSQHLIVSQRFGIHE